jgi:hypothetical protein
MDELHAALGRAEVALWPRLLHQDYLLARALAGGRRGSAPAADRREIIEACWGLLTQDGRVGEALAVACDFGTPLAGADPARLRGNARRFFAARVAAAWLAQPAHPDASAELSRWLGRLAGLPDVYEVIAPERMGRVAWSADPVPRLEQLLGMVPDDHRPLLALWLRHALGIDPVPAARSRRVPLASYGAGPDAATIHDLELALLGDGPAPGRLLESPALWNRPIAADFLAEIDTAFAAQSFTAPVAWSLAPRPLRDRPARLDALLRSRSHAAAARVGVHVLAHDLDYDPACLISARVDGSGNLGGVEGLRAKCDAALAHGISRVVIAVTASDPGLPPEAEAGYRPHLNVLRLTTLAEAIEEATGLPGALRRYLDWIVGLPEQDPPHYLGGRSFAELLIEPDVLRADRRPEAEAARTARSSPLGVSTEAREVDLYYGDDSSGRGRVPWQQEWPIARPAVIVGLPGSGKTMLARLTARAEASRGLEHLGRGEPLDRVPLPVCLRLADVATGTLEAAFRARFVAPDAPVLRESGVEYLVGRLLGRESRLILDGLDEVLADHRPALRAQLARLREAPCRVILTTRPFGYDRRELPLAAVTEYRLAPLDARQRWRFVDAWFRGSDDPGRAARVRSLLRGGPGVAEMGRNPLLLTLTCAVGEVRQLDPRTARRKDVYYGMAHELIRGTWKEGVRGEGRVKSDEKIGKEMRALGRMAYELFAPDPARTTFTVAECLTNLERQQFPPDGAEQLLAGWRECGLFVPTRDPETKEDARFFAHRTFLEYLAAWYAATLPDPVAVARPYLWLPAGAGGYEWMPAAETFLVFLASCLRHPALLLRELVRAHDERPDALGVMMRLAGRCLSESAEVRDDPVLVRRITTVGVRAWENLVPASWWSTPAPIDAFRHLGHRAGVDHLIDILRPESPGNDSAVRRAAAGALGELGDPSAVPPLLDALRDDDDIWVRLTAAEALGELVGPSAVPPLLDALRDDGDALRDGDVRAAVAGALGELGDPSAVPPLLDALRDYDSAVRGAAAGALIKFLRNPCWLAHLEERDRD